MHRPTKKEQGGTLVFTALSLVVLIVIVAIAINTGRISSVRTQAQAAVDAAALAGAAGLAPYNRITGGESNPNTVGKLINSLNPTNEVDGKGANIRSYVGSDVPPQKDFQVGYYDDLAKNFYVEGSSANIGGTTRTIIRTDVNAVRVAKRYPIDNFLARLIAPDQSNVEVSAVASIGGPTCAVPAFPLVLVDCPRGFYLGTQCNSCTRCTADGVCSNDGTTPEDPIELKLNAGDDNAAWFSLTAASPSAEEVRRSIQCSMESSVCVGGKIWLQNGVDNDNLQCIIDVKDHYFSSTPGAPRTCQGSGNGGPNACTPSSSEPCPCINRTDLTKIPNGSWDALVPVVDCYRNADLTKPGPNTTAVNKFWYDSPNKDEWTVVGLAYVRVGTVDRGSGKSITIRRLCDKKIPYVTGGSRINCGNTTENPVLKK